MTLEFERAHLQSVRRFNFDTKHKKNSMLNDEVPRNEVTSKTFNPIEIRGKSPTTSEKALTQFRGKDVNLACDERR
jgi:hypothetical protein